MHKANTESLAFIVVLAGVSATLHIGKLPPAIPLLRDALGVTLVQAGLLLSAVQLAGMLLGVVVGLFAVTLGLRRSMILGVMLLGAASAAGGFSADAKDLLLLRFIEGFGFLLVVLPAPGLIRRFVPPDKLALKLGFWGAHMPVGTALALLSGPWVMSLVGWRGWWWALAGVSMSMACLMFLTIPSDRSKEYAEVSSAKDNSGSWQHRLILTLTSRDPWFIALIFAMYSCQWLAVIGFLPTIFEQAGFSSAFAGLVTAVVSLANILGNVGAGHLLHRQFSALKLLRVAFFLMAICTLLAFGSVMNDLPVLRFVAVLFFSAIGGMIPAVLFSLAVQLAPNEQTISTTVGWVQQCSSAGQFVGPPLVAWAVVTIGGWGGIWMVACAASLVGYTFASILNARNNL